VKYRRHVNLSAGERDRRWHDRDAPRGADQGEERLRITGFENGVRVHVSEATGDVEHLADAETVAEQQDALILEVGDVERRASRQWGARGHRREHTHGEYQTAVEAVVAAPDREGQVGLSTLDELQRASPALFDQMDIHSGSRLQISGEERGKYVLDYLWRGADAELSYFAATHGVRVLDELLGTRQQLAASQQQVFTGTGHAHPAARPLEESDAQLGLEVVDLPPQRGLRDAQSRGGAREGARLGDGDEIAEVTEIHCLQGIA
jgi:hypothetical protein